LACNSGKTFSHMRASVANEFDKIKGVAWAAPLTL
jgi:hypothetical protein